MSFEHEFVPVETMRRDMNAWRDAIAAIWKEQNNEYCIGNTREVAAPSTTDCRDGLRGGSPYARYRAWNRAERNSRNGQT